MHRLFTSGKIHFSGLTARDLPPHFLGVGVSAHVSPAERSPNTYLDLPLPLSFSLFLVRFLHLTGSSQHGAHLPVCCS